MQGNPIHHRELMRANIDNAKAVFILSDKLSNDSSSADTQTILQAMVIKNFL